MKIYSCGACGNTVHFQNRICMNCGHRLGFAPGLQMLLALEPQTDEVWRSVGGYRNRYMFCANARSDICNWLIEAEHPQTYCFACRYNRLVPNALDAWRRINNAEKELFYSFLRWGLPCPGRDIDPEGGLVFDFLEDGQAPAVTGHDEGVISIRAAEADDVVRETLRATLHEPYRTLLGHFRHEAGHFIWNKMVRDAGLIDACRAVFGDERLDYAEAAKQHYDNGPPAGWQDNFISAYASMHPWEDFAESFAHCLHIVDALETAHSYGVALHPSEHRRIDAEIRFDPYQIKDFDRLAEAWIPLSLALNSIHESMGERPLYPFILSAAVRAKLNFVLQVITRQMGQPAPRRLSPKGGLTGLLSLMR